MRLEEAQQGGEQRRVGGPALELVRPDSGQTDEPLRPSVGTKRCRKSGQGKCDWVIVDGARQSLRQS